MDAELKQTLVDMETRIFRHVDERIESVTRHVDVRLASFERHFEERIESFYGHVAERLDAFCCHFAERVGNTEAKLLSAMHQFEVRLGFIENRLDELERGLRRQPPASSL